MERAAFFETPRLCARRFGPDDVGLFVAYRAEPEVARYQSWSDYTKDQGAALIESMQEAEPGAPGEWFQFALEERTSGALVGDLALKVDADEARVAQVGFTLAPAHQGKGYGAEALEAMLDWAFETFGLHRIYAVTDALNVPAATMLERVGFRCEAHFHDNVWFKGAWGSELLFAILEREWAAGT